MPPQNISLSMMQFEPGPLMAVELDAERMPAPDQVICDESPSEIDIMLSMVAEPNPIFLDDYRTRLPARRAG